MVVGKYTVHLMAPRSKGLGAKSPSVAHAQPSASSNQDLPPGFDCLVSLNNEHMNKIVHSVGQRLPDPATSL